MFSRIFISGRVNGLPLLKYPAASMANALIPDIAHRKLLFFVAFARFRMMRDFPESNRDAKMLAYQALRRAGQPVDGSSAAAFRIVFGLMGLIAVIRFFLHGWIDALYIEPERHFSYLGFGWVDAWPGWGMYVHFAALGLFSIGIAAGCFYRVCAALFFLGFTYVELIDRTTYLNHYYWMSLVSLMMVFLPLHRAASVDAWRSNRPERNPEAKSGFVPAGVIWILRAQVAAVYLFAGIAKLNPDWLFHGLPLRIWLYQQADLPLIGPLLAEAWAAYAMSWAGAIFDLTIAGWLLWKRTRVWGCAVLAAFHVMTAILFPRLGVFPWLMMGAALIFLPPDWPRQLMDALSRGLPFRPALPASAQLPPGPPRPGVAARAGAVALAVFVAFQVAMPLRHYAYPGNVRWNEEGYRFAWRVMLTEKTGVLQFRVRDLDSGQAWLVYPDAYLTPLQTERMAIHPDMILQTAHIIAGDFEQRGHRVSVNADAYVSFNGRRHARLIDPEADLASVEAGLNPKPWVLPQPPGKP